MVASVSGAHTIAFEPQTNLRSVINLGGRLNQVSDRLRILPFAVLDKFRKIAMSNFDINDGGIGFLDFDAKDSIMQTQTIRLDHLPSFDILFGGHTSSAKSLLNSPQEIDPHYAAAIKKLTDAEIPKVNDDDSHLLLRQPIHFLKIDVEGFELQALDSAAQLFESGLVEHCVLEFGPPHRWDVTIEDRQNMTLSDKRRLTTDHAKRVLNRATTDWNMDIYLLPAIGWENSVKWMLSQGVNYNKKQQPGRNKVVHYLKSWDFDGKPQEGDEFEAELKAKNQIITEVIPLPPKLINPFLDDLHDIGEVYLWFVKRTGNPNVVAKLQNYQ